MSAQLGGEVTICWDPDDAFLEYVLGDADVFAGSADDFAMEVGRVEAAWLRANPAFRPLGVRVGPEVAGLFLLVMHSMILFEVHTAILPAYRGRVAEQAARLFLEELFERTSCRKLITLVPAFNRSAALFSRRFGLRVEGVITASFLRDGRLHDQTLFGISKADYLERRAGGSRR